MDETFWGSYGHTLATQGKAVVGILKFTPHGQRGYGALTPWLYILPLAGLFKLLGTNINLGRALSVVWAGIGLLGVWGGGRKLGKGAGFLSVLMLGLATPYLFSARYLRPEAAAFGVLALSAWAGAERRWFLLGFLAGLAPMARAVGVVAVPGPLGRPFSPGTKRAFGFWLGSLRPDSSISSLT